MEEIIRIATARSRRNRNRWAVTALALNWVFVVTLLTALPGAHG